MTACRTPRPEDYSDTTMVLGPYRLLRHLGVGGMSTVYKALDTRTGAYRAIKFNQNHGNSAVSQVRFLREANIGMTIACPHLVRVHAIDRCAISPFDGCDFLVMDVIEGEHLGAVNDGGRQVSVRHGVQILRQVLVALRALHQAGVLHRDVKPANVMMDDAGRVTLIDLGLACTVGQDDDEDERDSAIGTLGFMAPEIFKAQGCATVQSDLFSLGASVYHLLAGRGPFPVETVAGYLENVRIGAVPLNLVNPLVPADLSTLIHHLMADDPRDRPARVEDVFHALEPVLAVLRLPDRQTWAARCRGEFRRVATIAGRLTVNSLGAEMTSVNRRIIATREALRQRDFQAVTACIAQAEHLRQSLCQPSAQCIIDSHIALWRRDLRWLRLRRWWQRCVGTTSGT